MFKLKLKQYSEEEWFNTFYPQAWGDWKTHYNIGMSRKTDGVTGCCWMDYTKTGVVLGEDKETGLMKIIPWSSGRPDVIEVVFIECGHANDKENVAFHLQPYFQPQDQTYYAKVVLSKMESNLNLYSIYISGNDDSSYTKHFVGLNAGIDALADLRAYDQIRDVGFISDLNYFFTN